MLRAKRIRTLLGLATATLCAGLVGASPPAAPCGGGEVRAGPVTDPAAYVDPFIGTRNEGNTFPGAAVPFGKVQLSPDTTGSSTGYDWDEDRIRGFSSVHLSGVGCRIGGDLPVMPTTGDITSTDNNEYASGFRHAKESASPGSYKVALDDYGGTTAELTAGRHTGHQRYTFPATGKANVLLNSGQALHKVTDSTVRVLDERTIAAKVTGSGFCQGTEPYTVWTVTRFERPFDSYGTWDGDEVTDGGESSSGGGRRGAYARFDTRNGDRDVEAVTSLSYVDEEGAARNLAAEGGRSFDETRDAARRAWQERLDDVRVSGGSEARLRVFYSSLYRALLHPNVGEDVDRRYRGWDQKIHRAKGHTYYQNWSLWDTYRTQAQLLALVAPRESRDMALSLLDVDAQGGWLPRWGYATRETNIMAGDPVTPFLANAYQQGLLTEDEGERAYRALKKNADGVPPADSPYLGRTANKEYIEGGYIPHQPDRKREKPGSPDFRHSGSATLEYATADAALAGMARDLGHDSDADRYAERSRNYRNILDPGTGFPRARKADGTFAGPADPSRSEGFHEGTAWQYMWMVPQDVPGLISRTGGREATEKRLDSFFAYDELTEDPRRTAGEEWVAGPYEYYDSDKYNPQNEHDLLAPYTYLSTGSPWKTTDVVDAALCRFTDSPEGVTGNDDLGTMSSWMVLSAMGIYPVAPGADTWALNTPAFERVELTLDRDRYPEGRFTIRAPRERESDRYIRSVSAGGSQISRTWISTDDIRRGRSLDFRLGPEPSEWGTGKQDAPPPLGQPNAHNR
ncbi:GH92 family glycosyl hydrolase [Streptomyces sp. WMMB 322]|uniref:GH92 family glycosyl hydrolase n=1 Tax=Streptomyces sp. WMMB 322 TaxID=1286821 RepID=UPI000823B703|nr:GH92 family glycosyl hydrolase [Streptomyces sp. WMMB 322]SCK58742.1 alpha-1,2-mannosidase, putative [Streptomyces sp. WMMB 322]